MGNTLIDYLLREMERAPPEDLKNLFSNAVFDYDTVSEIRNFLSPNKGRSYEQAINEYLARPEEERPDTEEFLFGLNRLIAFSMRGDLPERLADEEGLSALPPSEFKTGEDLYDVLVDRLALDSSWVVIREPSGRSIVDAGRRKAQDRRESPSDRLQEWRGTRPRP